MSGLKCAEAAWVQTLGVMLCCSCGDVVMLLQQPVHTLVGTTLAVEAVTSDVNAAAAMLFSWCREQKKW